MIVINYDLYYGCNGTLWSDIHNSILFPLVERCGFSLAGPESHSWGVVIDSKLLRKKFFQAARQSWHRFKRFCVELLGRRHTSSLVPYRETEMLGKDRRRASRWIKAKKRELSTGWWKLKKEKGNRIPSSNCQWTRSKLNLHGDPTIFTFLTFWSLVKIRRTSCEWRRPRFYIDPSLSADEEVTLRTLMPHQCAFPRGSIPSCLLDYKWKVAGFCVNLCQSLQVKAVLETGREGH